MVVFVCDRCGAKVSGKTEHATEVAWTAHTCKGMRKLSDMPLNILRRVALGEITEAQGWELTEQQA